MVALGVWICSTLFLAAALCRPLGGAGLDLGKYGVVGVGYASYRGVDTYGDVTSYLGIPYAEPPLGDLRFRAPKPLDVVRVSRETGGDVVNATQYPDFCVQGAVTSKCSMVPSSDPTFTEADTGGNSGGAGSEDCLKVNIYTPSKAKAGSNCESEFFVLPLDEAFIRVPVPSTRASLHSRWGLYLRESRQFPPRSLGPPEPRSRHCIRLLPFDNFRVPLPP